MAGVHYYLLQYTVREAAEASGLWKTASYMEEISCESLNKFYEAVSANLVFVGLMVQ